MRSVGAVVAILVAAVVVGCALAILTYDDVKNEHGHTIVTDSDDVGGWVCDPLCRPDTPGRVGVGGDR